MTAAPEGFAEAVKDGVATCPVEVGLVAPAKNGAAMVLKSVAPAKSVEFASRKSPSDELPTAAAGLFTAVPS
jgi:hypothetical protein